MGRNAIIGMGGALIVTAALGCHREIAGESRLQASTSMLELLALAESKDDVHPIEVVDGEGRSWYREEGAGLNLRYIEPSSGFVQRVGSDWCINLAVRPGFQERLHRWSQEHIDADVGWLYRSRLIAVAPLGTTLSNMIVVCGFSRPERAESALYEIQRAMAAIAELKQEP